MKVSVEVLSGMEKIKVRFLDLLENRQCDIASNALAAWDAQTMEQADSHLAAARDILHQIAGSAGSLGFGTLGQAARECETSIIYHLENRVPNTAPCPRRVIEQLDSFMSVSQNLLAAR